MGLAGRQNRQLDYKQADNHQNVSSWFKFLVKSTIVIQVIIDYIANIDTFSVYQCFISIDQSADDYVKFYIGKFNIWIPGGERIFTFEEIASL